MPRSWVPVAIVVVVAGILVWRLWAAVSPADSRRTVNPYHPTTQMPSGLRTPQLLPRPRSITTLPPNAQRSLFGARNRLTTPVVDTDGAAVESDADATAAP